MKSKAPRQRDRPGASDAPPQLERPSDLDALLAEMTSHSYLARQAEERVLALGREARRLGATWQQIAEAICITQQAAQQRWATPLSTRG